MKAVVAAFNQEKALVGAFSVIVQPVVEPMEHYTALLSNASPAEGHIVWAGCVLGGVPRHALVVRVVGHQVPSVHVGRQLGKYL